MNIIILAGMPATGKSTLAAKLQEKFGYPILEKDYIKEGLFDTLGFSCYAEKRALDVAANEVLLRWMNAMIEVGQPMIIDNNFDQQSAAKLKKLLQEHPCKCVTVFMNGLTAEAFPKGLRHLGHAMQTHYPPLEGEDTTFHMTREGFDQRFLHLGMHELSWGGEKILVDATILENIDAEAIIEEISSKLA